MIDDIVCQRTYQTVVDGVVLPVPVRWFRPRQNVFGDWMCEYLIEWPHGPHRTFKASGMDSVQALELALGMVATELYVARPPVFLFEENDRLHLPAVAAIRALEAARNPPPEFKMPETEILIFVDNGVGRISLNRPKAIHALNLAMCEQMSRMLWHWRDDEKIHSIVIDHAGERGFCAGGDIRMIAESGASDGVAAKAFFLAEYRLNDQLFHYPKPITAIVDGIVMGGGVGLSEPADVRIATERTTYAMPETGIGLYPEVGAGWFLPRLPGETGVWIGLTGARLKAADTVALGIHTHFVPSEGVAALKADLLAEPLDPAAVAARHALDAGPAPLAPHREAIDRLFAFDTIEAIFAALEAEGSDWALAQLATLKTKSPTSLKVTLRHIREGAKATSFSDNMAVEYAVSGRIGATHDFQEGVRAVIVDKDNTPRWSPPDLSGVTEATLDALFAPLPDNKKWTPLDR
jgi:enoyl-CoA hydratase